MQEEKWTTICWYWKITDYVSLHGVLAVYIMLVDKGDVIEKYLTMYQCRKKSGLQYADIENERIMYRCREC